MAKIETENWLMKFWKWLVCKTDKRLFIGITIFLPLALLVAFQITFTPSRFFWIGYLVALFIMSEFCYYTMTRYYSPFKLLLSDSIAMKLTSWFWGVWCLNLLTMPFWLFYAGGYVISEKILKNPKLWLSSILMLLGGMALVVIYFAINYKWGKAIVNKYKQKRIKKKKR